MRLALFATAVFLAGCLSEAVNSEPETLPGPCANDLPSTEVVLESGSYRVTHPAGSFGGGSAWPLEFIDLNRTQRLEITAEWDDNPLFLDEVVLFFLLLDEEPPYQIQGSSPLTFTIDLPLESIRSDAPVVDPQAPRQPPAGVAVGVVDQPIRLTIREIYAC